MSDRPNASDVAAVLCAHCGTRQDEHRIVNYADGPFVSRIVLVCPTAIYQPQDTGLKREEEKP